MYSNLDSTNIKPIAEPLFKQRHWLKLVAVLMMAGGVLTALTIVGIVVAWIPIWGGIALYQSASTAEDAMITRESNTLVRALSKLGLYFKLRAVTSLLILGLIPLMGVSAVMLSRFVRYARPKNEADAVANIQKLNTAESKYMSTHQRYGTLRELVDAGLAERSSLDSVSGYELRIETQQGNYVVLASTGSLSGRYDYYSFADAIIRYSSDPRRAPPGLSAAPVP